MHRQVFLGS